MNRSWERLAPRIAITVTLMLASIGTTNVLAEPLRPSQWESRHYADHPLVGSVWQGEGARSDWSELSARIAQARYVLVGEIHTNADHHRIQANVLNQIAKQGRKSRVVWEMIPQEKQSILDAIDPGNTNAASELGKALGWAASGWPDWTMYEPIAAAALKHALPMTGAALQSKFVRTVMSSNGESLSLAQKERLSLNSKLSDEQSDSMLQSLHEGHCQLMDKNQLKPMVWVQRARDGAMARAMFDTDETDQNLAQTRAVLIAGNGHVRKDWGVPAVLSQLDPAGSILSIAQIEVSEGMDSPTEYRELSSAQRLHDFVIFTPRSEIRDHCAELRKRFKRK